MVWSLGFVRASSFQRVFLKIMSTVTALLRIFFGAFVPDQKRCGSENYVCESCQRLHFFLVRGFVSQCSCFKSCHCKFSTKANHCNAFILTKIVPTRIFAKFVRGNTKTNLCNAFILTSRVDCSGDNFYKICPCARFSVSARLPENCVHCHFLIIFSTAL